MVRGGHRREKGFESALPSSGVVLRKNRHGGGGSGIG